VKRVVAASGSDAKRFAGHSLRRGLVTAAAGAKRGTRKIQEVTGHASSRMVELYVKHAGLWDEHASAGLLDEDE